MDIGCGKSMECSQRTDAPALVHRVSHCTAEDDTWTDVIPVAAEAIESLED